MPVEIFEHWESRDGTLDVSTVNSAFTLRFGVIGTEDEREVHTLVQQNLPIAYNVPTANGDVNFYYQSYSIERKGQDLWQSEAKYLPFYLEVIWSADTAGETVTVQQSKETILTVVDGEVADEAPDFRGAMNVNGDTVAGVEIAASALVLQAQFQVPRALFTEQWQRDLMSMTATVNDAPWRGFERGEVLFRGATWTDRSSLPVVEVQAKFNISLNDAMIPVGNLIVPFKEGWHLLWIRYQDESPPPGEALPVILKVPVAAYVERVYDYSDFTWLGLGN